VATVEVMFAGPITCTPRSVTTVSPDRVTSQFPPCSHARSTTTEPGAIPSTISAVTSTGARRPGTWAVVITTSAPATALAISSRWRRSVSSWSSWAYAPDPESPPPVSSSISRNRAPRLPTSSRTAGRTSYASTTAPSRRAVAIACSPATPAPTTNTRAGVIVPAAVVSNGYIFGSASAARTTAL
jgi:hypothetical protein